MTGSGRGRRDDICYNFSSNGQDDDCDGLLDDEHPDLASTLLAYPDLDGDQCARWNTWSVLRQLEVELAPTASPYLVPTLSEQQAGTPDLLGARREEVGAVLSGAGDALGTALSAA